MPTYELLREGEWTDDGRMLTPDTTTWREEQIPLMSQGNDDHFGAVIIGKVSNIHRVGNKILGETSVEIGEGKALTCDTDRVDDVTEHEDGCMEMTGVRLIGAYVNEADKYPWKDNEEGGGEADGS
jgi:hypothetical protein